MFNLTLWLIRVLHLLGLHFWKWSDPSYGPSGIVQWGECSVCHKTTIRVVW